MPVPRTLETARLRLRAPADADVDPLFAIQGDPETMRFSWCAPSRADTAWHLRSHADAAAAAGIAPWTVEEKASGRVIGWGGLRRDGQEAELSYFFARSRWGEGFATELVGASVAHGFEGLRLARLVARVRPGNGASIRVLEKHGFLRDADADREAGEHGFSLDRSAWRERRRAAAKR